MPPDDSQVREATRRLPRWLAPTVDSAPLAVFFIAYAGWNLFVATASMLIATAFALALSLAVVRHIPITASVSAALLAVFGGLTLWLNDADYLKLQSTVISGLFSLALFAALGSRRPLLRWLLGAALVLDDEGWRLLTLRCAIFFAALAGLNEMIARTQTTALWVEFNVFGTTGLTLAFLVAQWPLVNRHRRPR